MNCLGYAKRLKESVQLVFDVGNTSILVGVVTNAVLNDSFRIVLSTGEDSAQIAATLVKKTKEFEISPSQALICSVNPAYSQHLQSALAILKREQSNWSQLNIKMIDFDFLSKFISFKYPEPKTVGHDRLVNAIAAINRTSAPTIILDCGSATTISLVNSKLQFCGGLIAPGLPVLHEALSAKGALLPDLKLEPENLAQAEIIGTSTAEAMQAGLFWGYREMVAGLLRQTKNAFAKIEPPVGDFQGSPPVGAPEGTSDGRFQGSPQTLITGGYGQILDDQSSYYPDLILDGLIFILNNRNLW